MIKMPRYRNSVRALLLASAGFVAGLVEGVSAGPVASRIAEFKDQYYVSALAFNADGSQLAVNFMVAGDEVHIWSWHGDSKLIRRLEKPGSAGDGYALSYSADGGLLAVRNDITRTGQVTRIWNAHSGEIVHDIVVGADERGQPGGIAFSPDGKLFIRTITRGIDSPGEQFLVHGTDMWDRSWGLRTVPFQPRLVSLSPDGRLAALGGETWSAGSAGHPELLRHPQIVVVELDERKITRTIDRVFSDGDGIYTLAWSPDGLRIAAGCKVGGDSPGPNAVNIFELVTGKQIASVPAESATVTGLSYSPNGKYLIAGSVDDGVRILDGHSFGMLQKISGDARTLAISRDSRYLAIAAGKNISIWALKE